MEDLLDRVLFMIFLSVMWILALYFLLQFMIYETSSWFSVRTGFFLLILLTVPIPFSIFLPYERISIYITDLEITFTQTKILFSLIIPKKKVILSKQTIINYNKKTNVISFEQDNETNKISLKGLDSKRKGELIRSLNMQIQKNSNINYIETDEKKG
jgi:hypothetical protein